jgi:hypothetical protein
MTPELKTACQVVFQEHKSSPYPVTWNRDAFRGRISTGLSEMAKETLIKKNIIQFPNPSKKILTVLNPAAATAATYEEAEDIILNKIMAPMSATAVALKEKPVAAKSRAVFVTRSVTHHPVVTLAATHGKLEAVMPMVQMMEQVHEGHAVHGTKWYLKPVFVYGIWPVCAAIAGGVIAYLMGSAYTELVFDFK